MLRHFAPDFYLRQKNNHISLIIGNNVEFSTTYTKYYISLGQFIQSSPMVQKLQEANPSDFKKYASQFSNFGSDYIFSRVNKSEQMSEISSHTLRLRGMNIVLCLKGSINLNINLEPYQLTSGTLLVMGRDSVVSIESVESCDFDAYILVMSPEFIRDINFEINVLATASGSHNHHGRPQPLSLTENETALIRRYFDLIHFNTIENSNARYVRSISRSLIAAMIYQMIQLMDSRTGDSSEPGNLSRRANYVREFMHLVQQNFRSERGVSFYASKLFISPKYLSQIIKESTGRSAAEWIDEYVIIEAKNLLRFSGKNIQQVAYDLNFPNQSSFGKYFKNLTGMSPTKFQRS